MTLNQMRQWVFIEVYEKHDGEKVILVTCRCYEAQKEYPVDTDLSVIQPFVDECVLCREKGERHGKRA